MKFYHEQAKTSINRKLKFIILEDAVQIMVQIYISNRMGLTGFRTLISPVVGLLNMFLGIKDWHSYNWDDTSFGTRLKKVALIIIQVMVFAFICLELFKFNAPPPNFYAAEVSNAICVNDNSVVDRDGYTC